MLSSWSTCNLSIWALQKSTVFTNNFIVRVSSQLFKSRRTIDHWKIILHCIRYDKWARQINRTQMYLWMWSVWVLQLFVQWYYLTCLLINRDSTWIMSNPVFEYTPAKTFCGFRTVFSRLFKKDILIGKKKSRKRKSFFMLSKFKYFHIRKRIDSLWSLHCQTVHAQSHWALLFEELQG